MPDTDETPAPSTPADYVRATRARDCAWLEANAAIDLIADPVLRAVVWRAVYRLAMAHVAYGQHAHHMTTDL